MLRFTHEKPLLLVDHLVARDRAALVVGNYGIPAAGNPITSGHKFLQCLLIVNVISHQF